MEYLYKCSVETEYFRVATTKNCAKGDTESK